MSDYRRYAEACRQMALTAIDQTTRHTLLETAATLEEVAVKEDEIHKISQRLENDERK